MKKFIFIFSLLLIMLLSFSSLNNNRAFAQTCSSTTCTGHAYYACTGTGTCCDFTYRCSGTSCIAACHAGVSVSSCGGCCAAGTTWNGSSCVAAPTSTPAPTTPPSTCTSGTGSTSSSCGGLAYYACSSYSPPTCCAYTYRCSGSSCVTGCHTAVSTSYCTGGCTSSATPTPTPTQAPLSCTCYYCSGSTLVTTTVSGSCSSNGMSNTPPSCGGGVCPPTSSCSAQGAVCGTIWNGCSYIPCGTCGTGYTCSGNQCILAPTPSPSPPPTYTISGNVFVDTNGNGTLDAGESNYTGAITITSTSGTVATPDPTTNAAGSYQVSGLLAGTYTVAYTNLPVGYQFTEPLNGTSPRSFTVSVGGTCTLGGSVTGSKNAKYDSNCNISALDFGINNELPWIQSTGSDMRIDSGFSDPIPAGAACGSYASNLSTVTSKPGVIYSGAGNYNFGQGQASQTPPYGWTVGGPAFPESFTPAIPGVVRTSYNYINSLLTLNGITATPIANYCGSGGTASCTLSSTLPNGVYSAPNGLTLSGSGYNFPTGKNYVILVKGDLYIDEPVLIPDGSTAFFTVSGSIFVGPNVGESNVTRVCTPPTALNQYSSYCDVEGYYSSDNYFYVQGASSCPTNPDLKLNVSGAIVVNAALNNPGGYNYFVSQRDLCTHDSQCPAFTVTERPDFVLNSPFLIMNTKRIYQEVAP